MTADDGVRVYVDDKRVVDAWVAQSPAGYSTTVYLNPGPHKWRVEYFEEFGGAQISVQIVPGVSPPPPSNPSPSAGDIVVDAAGTGWVQGGNPVAWRNAPSGYGGTSITANNDAFVQPLENWGRWYPEIKAGNYEVFAYIPKDVATTRNARYWISHAGRIDSVVRSQDGVEDDWVSLGTFNFSGGGSEYISLSDVTYECYLCTTVVWDAIKLSPR